MEMKSVITDSPGNSTFIRGTFLVLIHEVYIQNKTNYLEVYTRKLSLMIVGLDIQCKDLKIRLMSRSLSMP